MLVRFIKNAPAADADVIACIFPDGTRTSGPMARQGVLPHEAFHFVVEKTFGWRDAFFGQIELGASIEAVTAKLHDPKIDRTKNTQALQSESLVECLQNEQARGAADPAAFAQNLILSCRRRGVPPPDITADELTLVRTGLREFGAAWRPLPISGSLERSF